MSPEGESRPQASAPKRPLLPPSRIVLILVLVAAVVVFVLELRAKSAYEKSYQAIDDAMAAADEKNETLEKTAVDDLLQGDLEREADEASNTELFTWKGLYRVYEMKLTYRRNDDTGSFYVSKIEQPE
ncbi:MAG TPA: hypothetical protein VMY42_22600 [Thermoguttaceae bacterium]|nr:hypothetical protein [Thermoguttaceae bacterium]